MTGSASTLDVVAYYISVPLLWKWQHDAPHKNPLKMGSIEEPELLQCAMRVLQEYHRAHGVGSDHEAVSKIDVGLASFAFNEEVSNRVSMFPETFKEVSRSRNSIYDFGVVAKPSQFRDIDFRVGWHPFLSVMLIALLSQPPSNLGCAVVDTKRTE